MGNPETRPGLWLAQLAMVRFVHRGTPVSWAVTVGPAAWSGGPVPPRAPLPSFEHDVMLSIALSPVAAIELQQSLRVHPRPGAAAQSLVWSPGFSFAPWAPPSARQSTNEEG
jgi:hypothetical protein